MILVARRLLLPSTSRRYRVIPTTQHILGASLASRIRSSLPSTRCFSKTTDDDNDGSPREETDDPFGVHFEDGVEHGKIGPSIPPKYKRDAMTSKFTGEIVKEMSENEKKLVSMDSIQEQDYLLDRFLEDWDSSEKEDTGPKSRQTKLAKRIRQDNMGLNILGRSVEAQTTKSTLEDGEGGYKDSFGFSKPLSPGEFRAFQEHMQHEYNSNVTEEDIPTENTSSGESQIESADTEYLNSKWLSSKAVRFMDSSHDDDPFSDLSPSDLSPSRLVNRKQAKPIPKELFHHNNLALLRRYITPTGQIMSRMHSRLGAKDQRKIAKLIKRARHLGLLPHAGQFAVEIHGSIYEKDINEDKEWETELARRGLVVGKKSGADKDD